MLFRLVGQILAALLKALTSLARIEQNEGAIRDTLSALIQEQGHQAAILDQILAAVTPSPAVGFVFSVELEGQISQGVTQLTITNSQKFTASIQPVDKKGQPASVDGIPVWASSDETILTVTAAADGLSAEVAAVGPLGSAKVAVSADADLGAGVATIFGSLDVSVTQGQAVGFKIATTDPVEQ